MSKSKVSTRKLEANRANAKKSTGPRTLEGKRQSSKNSIKHGLFSATESLMDGDHLEAFNLHRVCLLNSLNPLNFIQLRTCELIIQASWNMRRAAEAEKVSFCWEAEARRERYMKQCVRKREREAEEREENDPDFDTEGLTSEEWAEKMVKQDLADYGTPNSGAYLLDLLSQETERGACSYERLQRYRIQQERSYHRNLAELRRLKKDAREDTDVASDLTEELINHWESAGDVSEETTADEPENDTESESEIPSTPSPETVSPTADSSSAKTNPPKPNPPARPIEFRTLDEKMIPSAQEAYLKLEAKMAAERERKDKST